MTVLGTVKDFENLNVCALSEDLKATCNIIGFMILIFPTPLSTALSATRDEIIVSSLPSSHLPTHLMLDSSSLRVNEQLAAHLRFVNLPVICFGAD